jgi:hypothetical protein
MPALRHRLPYVAAALITIVAGLAVHRSGGMLHATAKDMLGDALWAMMMLWWMSVPLPQAPLRTRAMAALAICFAVEASQLYHTPTLDAWRATTIGHLVLGSGFDARDLLSYTLGVLAGAALALRLRPRVPLATA